MSVQISQPYSVFLDTDGKPLQNGYIYIGTQNLNPETNPIACYWDSALTLPAAQPIRTTNGMPSRNGQPGTIYTSTQFSITVRNANSDLIIHSPTGIIAIFDASSITYTPVGGAGRTVDVALGEIATFGASGEATVITHGKGGIQTNTASGYSALSSNTTGYNNTADGYFSLLSNTTGYINTAVGLNSLRLCTTSRGNTAVGVNALYNTSIYVDNTPNPPDFADTSGYNTGVGAQVLFSNTTGFQNAACGSFALYSNTTGKYNVALGSAASQFNVTGDFNVSIGTSTNQDNTSGSYNTAVGGNALYKSTGTSYNTAVGGNAAFSNLTGQYNVALGAQSQFSSTSNSQTVSVGYNTLYNWTGTGLTNNTAIGFLAMEGTAGAVYTGTNNTAVGAQSLRGNYSGTSNTAYGIFSLTLNTTGSFNASIGSESLRGNTTGSNNTCIGFGAGYTATPANANVTGNNNTWLGFQSGPGTATQLNNSIAIGNGALNTASNQVVIGNSSITETNLRGVVRNPTVYTVATLPTGTQGARAMVTDANAPTFLAAVAGGGAVVCPVFHNGTAWIVG